MWQSSLLSKLNHINHTFFGRKGGVSTGVFDSLNTSFRVPDLAHNVEKNRNIVSKHFSLSSKSLLTLHQTHSNRIIHITDTTHLNIINTTDADGMLTNENNIILSVVTADCIPILIAHKTKPYISSIHCGWQGLINGILPNIILSFNKVGCNTEDLILAIGPCIQQASYEVERPFYEKITSYNKQYKQFFIKKNSQKFLFNLPKCAEYILTTLHVVPQNIDNLAQDTYANSDDFFSHRRATVLKEESRGLQISCINLKDNK